MMTLAKELEAHGHGDEADDVYRRIVQWYEADAARPTPPRSGRATPPTPPTVLPFPRRPPVGVSDSAECHLRPLKWKQGDALRVAWVMWGSISTGRATLLRRKSLGLARPRSAG